MVYLIEKLRNGSWVKITSYVGHSRLCGNVHMIDFFIFFSINHFIIHHIKYFSFSSRKLE